MKKKVMIGELVNGLEKRANNVQMLILALKT